MKTYNTEYLSKSSVGSPLNFKKSPGKYLVGEVKNDNGHQLEKSTASTSRKEWTNTNYNNIKRIPDEFNNLRQTFDSRTNARLAEKFAKYNFNETHQPDPNQAVLRSTISAKLTSPYRDLTASSAYGTQPRKYDHFNYSTNYEKRMKSPGEEKKNINSGDKLKKYSQQVQKFKDQLETTNKMSEQLRRLKQDRRKRMQARQKQKEKEQDKNQRKYSGVDELLSVKTETFKKKDYYEYYTPKYQKSHSNRFTSKNAPATNEKIKTQKDQRKKVSIQKTEPDYLTSSKNQKISSSYFSSEITDKSLSIYDFEMGKNLGQGKFGVVYQAVHKKTGWLFAIKKVPKNIIKSHLMVDQFILELKLQTFLNHQNILGLFANFHDQNHVYLLLEYMEEGTLFTHLKKNKTLPEAEVAKTMKQIGSAIKYLHENQIAHRDIKPENIVMSHGICKLCDFGWATVCDNRRKTYCGTFDYAPPEILEGVQYDYTVDLWCLGVLAYELLVGKAPFYHISRKQTMKKILNVQKTNIVYPQHISKNAISFIDNLIKKDPKDRMGSDQILHHPFLKDVDNKKI